MLKAVYKYRDYLKIYKFNLKNKRINIKNFHKIVLKNASILILENIKTKKILLIKEFRAAHKKKIFGFPGGLIDKKETPLKCIKREAKEEIGIKINNVRLIGKFIRNGNYHCGIDYIFVASTRIVKIKTDDSVDFKWVSKNQLKNTFLKRNIFKNSGFFSAASLFLLKF